MTTATAGQRGDGAGVDAAGRALFEFCMLRDRRPDLDWEGASDLQRREWCRQAERIAGPALAAANERAEAAERAVEAIRQLANQRFAILGAIVPSEIFELLAAWSPKADQ